MTTTVSIDDALTCFGVHWNTSPAQAAQQFESWGFVGLHGIEKVEVLNGNQARWAAKDAADKAGDGHTYYWVGSFDASWIAKDSALYKFSYTGFTGPRTHDGDVRWAGYEAPPKESKQ